MARNEADDALAFNKGQQQQQQQHITGFQMKLPRWWCSKKSQREREREEAQLAVNADEHMQRLQQQQLDRIMSTDVMQAYIYIVYSIDMTRTTERDRGRKKEEEREQEVEGDAERG